MLGLTGWSLVPAQAVDVMSRLPGLMINVVFAGIMIGKALPSVKQIWNDAAPHVILGSVFSFGQFALGAFAVLFILTVLRHPRCRRIQRGCASRLIDAPDPGQRRAAGATLHDGARCSRTPQPRSARATPSHEPLVSPATDRDLGLRTSSTARELLRGRPLPHGLGT